MNQLEGAGAPPAPQDQIDALPTVNITQEQVGTLYPDLHAFSQYNIKFKSYTTKRKKYRFVDSSC